MNRSRSLARRVFLCVALVLVLHSSAQAQEKANADALALAARIDHHLAAAWKRHGIEPVARADDAEFLRRVYLDLAGHIPSILEVRDFLDDDRADKRQRCVERLLAADSYAAHFANVWRDELMPSTPSEESESLRDSFTQWLRKRLQKTSRYDVLVREILQPDAGSDEGSPFAFYQASDRNPANIAANVSRAFLGIHLECAQCHAHPFDRWKHSDFWHFAAFFAGVEEEAADKKGLPEITVPGTEQKMRPRFPGGKERKWKAGDNPRAVLADWMTAADNPYFARTAVNRVWAYLLGTGLIEPVDAPGRPEPPSHPELLDELARAFAAHKYDLKFLIRAITAGRAYQLTSAVRGKPLDRSLFAHAMLRPLSAEQLFDSLAEAIEYEGPTNERRNDDDGVPKTPRDLFRVKFSRPSRNADPSMTILQALYLMNGKFMTDATALASNRTLATIAEAADTSTSRQLDTLYLVALTRKPTARERSRLIAYLERSQSTEARRKALEDVFWVLLNSAEFCSNH